MKVNGRQLILILGLALASLPCQVFAAAYTNGSFEVLDGPGDAAAWTEVPSAPSAIAYPTNEGKTDGIRALAFNIGQTPSGSVNYQTFDTLLGQTYLVTFDFGNFGLAGNFTQLVQFEVRDGSSFNSGAELIDSGSGTSSGPGDAAFAQNNSIIKVMDGTVSPADAPLEFTSFSFSFTAISTTSTIVLTDQAGPPDANNSDAMVDNLQIALSAVPEPSTWITPSLVSGFLAVLYWRRRSNRQASQKAAQ